LGLDGPSQPLSSKFATALVLVLLIFTLTLVALSFPAGLYAVFHGGLSSTLGYGSFVMTFLWIGPLPTLLPFAVPIGALFTFLLVVYAFLFIYAIVQPKSPRQAVRDALSGGVGSLLQSPFILIIVAIGFLNFSGVIVTSVSEAGLGSVGNPFSTIDPLLEFGSLTFAPLREEIGFRVLLIGIVALILSLGRPPKTALKALWRPSIVFEGAAVGGAAATIIWAATLGSAVTFGVCHITCGGGGWSWAKFPDAAWGGLVLGYLYVRYGLHAAILTHWGVDYLGSVFSFFGQSAFGIPANSATTEYLGQYLVDYDMVFLFGLVSFLLVAYLSLRKAVAWRRERAMLVDKGPPPGPPPLA
jgi:hypothetical protein